MLRTIKLSLLSAILLALSFSTLGLSFLIWVSLVPLLFALSNLNPKQAFSISYTCGFLFFFLSMYWLIYVTPAGWILLSLYQALYVGIFGVAVVSATKKSQSNILTYIFIPACWTVSEYLRSHIGGGIGWNLLGYSQYQNLPIIQIADITGVYGISFLVVLINFAIFSIIKSAIKRQKTCIIQTILVLLITFFVLGYGYKKIETQNVVLASSPKFLKVSIVQGNIEQLYKWDEAYKDSIMKKYRQLTLKAAKDEPDIIIWPETSAPGYLDKDSPLYSVVESLAKRINIPLLVGAPISGDYNSALLFSKKGKLLQQYDKLHLVAFGEFIPFERYFPFLRKILPLTASFISGEEYTIFKSPANFGILICFEDIFPGIVRRFVKNGADFMVNMTNDAWFGRSASPYQHTANSVFRAVENRRPFIRSANTGLSCFIDSAGNIKNYLEIFKEGYKTDIIKLMPNNKLTFYTRFGDVFIMFCLLAIGVFLIDYTRRRGYNK